ncbi:MAG: nucleotide modification associated domain-containing protein [Alloprevotella sp.]
MENTDKGYKEARDFFQKAIGDFESQSASSKQLEALMAEFGRITDEMAELYQRKNMDYGNSFGRSYRELGIISAVTRMSDKMERMKHLVRKPEEQQVNDETLRDTIRDMACYAVMTLMEMDREKGGRE